MSRARESREPLRQALLRVRAVLRVLALRLPALHLPARVRLLPRIVLITNNTAENGVGDHVNS